MMKRLMMVMIALVLMVSGAQAQNVFAAAGGDTVNFGRIVGMEPASVKTNALLGTTVEVYEGITEDQFNRFGEALGEAGYMVTFSEPREGGMYYEVSKDSQSMTVLYSQREGRLEIAYGVDAQSAPGSASTGSASASRELPAVFKDCQLIEYGETVKIPGYGRLTIEKLVRGQRKDMVYSDLFIGVTKCPLTDNYQNDVYVVGYFENMSTDSLKWDYVLTCELYYITDENVYAYENWFTTSLIEEGFYLGQADRRSGVNFGPDEPGPFKGYIHPTVDSLEGGEFASVFLKVPDAVKKSDDGMLAVVITCGGNRYVVVDRWN